MSGHRDLIGRVALCVSLMVLASWRLHAASIWTVGAAAPEFRANQLNGQSLDVQYAGSKQWTVLCVVDSSTPPVGDDEKRLVNLISQSHDKYRWLVVSRSDIGLVDYSRHLRPLLPARAATVLGGIDGKTAQAWKGSPPITLAIVDTAGKIRFVNDGSLTETAAAKTQAFLAGHGS